MRVLTTAINDGERKVPEGHKVTHYRLAPGRALRWTEDGTTEVVEVTDTKHATYLFLLRWVEGRTLAIFMYQNREHGQPVRDDPAPKRSRAREALENAGALQREAVERDGAAQPPRLGPAPEPSGGRTLVKGAGSRRRALPAFVPLRK